MEKNKYIIFDANIWVAFYKKGDTLRDRTLAAIKKFEKTQKKCLVTNLIVEEVFSVLTYAGYKKLAHQFIDFCLNNQKVAWLDLDKAFIEKINDFCRSKDLNKSKLSLTDYSIIFLAHKFDFEILSFDKELIKIYNKIK